MKIKIVTLLAICAMFAACTASVNQNAANTTTNTVANTANRAANSNAGAKNFNDTANTAGAERVNPRAETSVDAKAKTACLNNKLAGKKLVAGQTFAFDFEPFRNSCFVSFGDSKQMLDEKDLPRGTEFYIFRDGKQIYQFPSAFDEMSGCWVEAVAFEDLNGDSSTDVVIAGKCLGAKDSYPTNAVYANTGDGFTTDNDANSALENFTKIKDIADFARKNKDKFFQQ